MLSCIVIHILNLLLRQIQRQLSCNQRWVENKPLQLHWPTNNFFHCNFKIQKIAVNITSWTELSLCCLKFQGEIMLQFNELYYKLTSTFCIFNIVIIVSDGEFSNLLQLTSVNSLECLFGYFSSTANWKEKKLKIISEEVWKAHWLKCSDQNNLPNKDNASSRNFTQFQKGSRAHQLGLVSLFNGISTFVGYLKPKPSL